MSSSFLVPREATVTCAGHRWPVRIEAIDHTLRSDIIDVSSGTTHRLEPGPWEEELRFELKLDTRATMILLGQNQIAPNALLELGLASASIFFDSAQPHPDGQNWQLVTVSSSFPAGVLEFSPAVWRRVKALGTGRTRIEPVPEVGDLIRLPNLHGDQG